MTARPRPLDDAAGDTERRLQALAEISRLITLGSDQAAIPGHVTQAISRLLPSPYVHLWHVDDETNDLILIATAGALTTSAAIGQRHQADAYSLDQAVLAGGRPYQTSDVLAEPRWLNRAVSERHGLFTYLGVPLMVGQHRYGVLTQLCAGHRVIPTADVALVETLAGQASAALANARADERIAALTDIARLVGETSDVQAVLDAAVEAAKRLVGLTHVCSWILETPAGPLRLAAEAPGGASRPDTMMALDGSLVGQVVRSGEILVRADPSAETRGDRLTTCRHASGSCIVVPIPDGEARLGVLVACGLQPRVFDEGDVRLLRALVAQMGAAIRNARLYRAARRQARQVDTLLDVNRRLALGPRLQEILSRITGEAAGLLGAEGATLRLVDGEELVRAATFGLGASLSVSERVRVGDSLIGRAVTEDRPIVVANPADDERHDPAHRAEARAVGLKSWLAVPMRGRDRVVGALAVYSRADRHFGADGVELLEAFANQAVIAVENAGLLAGSDRRAAEAVALAEVSRSITQSLDLQVVLDLIVDHACRLLGAERSSLAIVESTASGATIPVVAQRGLTGSFPLRIRPEHGRDGTTPIAIAEGRSVWSADVLDDQSLDLMPATRAAVEAAGYRASLSAPFPSADGVLGALTVYRDAPGPFLADEVKLLEVLADHASVAIANARLFQAERERRLQLETIGDVNAEITRELDLTTLLELIVQRAIALVKGDYGVVYLWSDREQSLLPEAWSGIDGDAVPTPVALGEGVVGMAAERREGTVVDGYHTSSTESPATFAQHDATAVIAEPISFQGRLIGVISVLARGSERRFEAGDRELLRLLAAQAAIAIENARLFRGAVRRRQHAEALREIGLSLTAAPNPPRVLQRIAEEARRLVGALFTYVVTPDRPFYRIVTVAGDDQGYRDVLKVSDDATSPNGRGPLGRAIRGRCPVVCDDILSDPSFDPWRLQASARGIRSLAAVPLFVQDKPYGALMVYAPTPRAYDTETLDLLASLGAQAAAALDNARLVEQAAKLEALERLAELKTEFLSTVSHELRTPLSMIHGYAELLALRAPLLTPEQIRDMAGEVQSSTRIMIRLVDDLLESSKIERGTLELRRQHVDAFAELRQLVERFRLQPGGERITADLRGRAEAWVDPVRLSQIASNLLTNALSYAPRGPIVVRGRRRPTSLLIEVLDRGPGIAAEDQQRLWEKFYRGARALCASSRGSGLGLTVVRDLVELHGGEVGVKSQIGSGATFWFTVPTTSAAADSTESERVATTTPRPTAS